MSCWRSSIPTSSETTPARARSGLQISQHKTKLCEQNGTVLKEYVEVPDALLAKTKELQTYFKNSLAYIATLKPKLTKKGRKA